MIGNRLRRIECYVLPRPVERINVVREIVERGHATGELRVIKTIPRQSRQFGKE